MVSQNQHERIFLNDCLLDFLSRTLLPWLHIYFFVLFWLFFPFHTLVVTTFFIAYDEKGEIELFDSFLQTSRLVEPLNNFSIRPTLLVCMYDISYKLWDVNCI